MTYVLEIQIEELRAELGSAVDRTECCQIRAELEIVEAELAVTIAELDSHAEAVPPF